MWATLSRILMLLLHQDRDLLSVFLDQVSVKKNELSWALQELEIALWDNLEFLSLSPTDFSNTLHKFLAQQDPNYEA